MGGSNSRQPNNVLRCFPAIFVPRHRHCRPSDDAALVKEAIELAKAQQAALVRQATVLIAKSGFVNCGAFRVGYLNDSVDAMDLSQGWY